MSLRFVIFLVAFLGVQLVLADTVRNEVIRKNNSMQSFQLTTHISTPIIAIKFRESVPFVESVITPALEGFSITI